MTFILLAVITAGALGYGLFGVVRSNEPKASAAPVHAPEGCLGCEGDQNEA